MFCLWKCYKRQKTFSICILLVLFAISSLCGITSAPAVQAAPTLEQVFRQAGQHFQVPVPLLKSLCYMEGRLSNHGGEASVDNGYGCMHLMMNDRAHSLTQAAKLLHIDPALLKTSMAWNIRGGAAVLHMDQLQVAPRAAASMTLSDWYPVIAAYSSTSADVAQLYADAVFSILRTGFSERAENGELVTLTPQAVPSAASLHAELLPVHHGGEMAATVPLAWQQGDLQGIPSIPSGCRPDHKTDYPGAVDCILNPHTYDCNAVKGNARCSYESARRPSANLPMLFVVIHDIEGTAFSAISTMRNIKSGVSIHYIVDSDGTVYQLVHESDIAYHAGNYWYNQRAIGIEHAGISATGYNWYNATLYLASARLTAYLLTKYHIPLDHDHILGHGTIPAPTLGLSPNHTDPGPYWLWDYYLNLIHMQGVPFPSVSENGTVITLRPLTASIPLGAGGDETPQNYNFFALYNGPSTDSGLIPHAGTAPSLDETDSIEPGVSYVMTNMVLDPAGSGKMLYQIWYGVNAHLNDKRPNKSASARQVWFAADPGMVSEGHGVALQLHQDAQLYGRPDSNATYQLGDAPAGAIFDAPFALYSGGQIWFVINYNHRQAWLPGSAVF